MKMSSDYWKTIESAIEIEQDDYLKPLVQVGNQLNSLVLLKESMPSAPPRY